MVSREKSGDFPAWQGGKRGERSSEGHFPSSENDFPGAGSHDPSEKAWFSGVGKRVSGERVVIFRGGKVIFRATASRVSRSESHFPGGEGGGPRREEGNSGRFFFIIYLGKGNHFP